MQKEKVEKEIKWEGENSRIEEKRNVKNKGKSQNKEYSEVTNVEKRRKMLKRRIR